MSSMFDIEHDRCRSLVCVVCYSKALRKLNDSEVELVEKYIIDGYSVIDQNFPCGICTTCSIALYQKSKDPDCRLKTVDEYDPERKTNLRSVSECDCKICKIAKMNGLAALKAAWATSAE